MKGVWRAFSWWFVVGACFLVGAVGVLAVQSVEQLRQADSPVRHSRDLTFASEQLLASLRDAVIGQRGYLITHRDEYLVPYRDAVAQLQARGPQVETLARSEEKTHALAVELTGISSQMQAEFAEVLRLNASAPLEAQALVLSDRGEHLMHRARDIVAKIQDLTSKDLFAGRADVERRREFVSIAVIATAGTSVLLLLTLAYVLRRDAKVIQDREEQLATTLRSIGDAVVATDELGRVTYMNPVASQLGQSRVLDPPQPFTEAFRLINETTGGPAENPVDRVLREGVTIGLANRTALMRGDGSMVPIEDSAAPLRNDDGSVRGVVFVFKDVTERRRAADELSMAKARLESILEAAEIGTWVWNAKTQLIESDRNLIRLYDLSAEEAASGSLKSYLNHVHPDDIANILERTGAKALKTGALEVLEFRVVRRDGSIRWLTGRGIVQLDETGEPEMILGLNMDVTELKRHEEELRVADRRKNEFLAILAHELRNPLAPIRHAVKLLAVPETNDLQRRWCHDVIARQVRHMARLLDDLLDVARITRGQLELKREPIALQSIVMDAIDTARPLIEAKKHTLNTALPVYAVMLDVDGVRIAQVLSNLLTNAAKYMNDGGQITLTAEMETNELTIAVKDVGLGISKESLPRLFEMFSQLDSSLDRAEGGLGIGLALVAGLMRLHGGRVEARSGGIGRGSEFVIHLPRSVIRSRAVSDETLTSPVLPKLSLHGKVLVADDNQDAANSLALLLELAGHKVFTASNGVQALEIGEREKPKAIILDIGMPGMSGYEVARRIRASEWGARGVLIAVTGWGQKDDKERAAQAGFDHHLTKPVDPDYVEQLLAQCFSEA